MGRPRTDPDATPTVERLLAAAEVVFAERGFAGARLSEIARGAGVSSPSLVYHFPTKETLYAAVVARTFERVAARLSVGMGARGEFPERLDALVREFRVWLREHPHQARLVVRELVEVGVEPADSTGAAAGASGPGRRLLADQIAPLVDVVVAFLEREGAGWLAPGRPLKAAVLLIASDTLLRNASADLAAVLWGPDEPDPAITLTRALLLAPKETRCTC